MRCYEGTLVNRKRCNTLMDRVRSRGPLVAGLCVMLATSGVAEAQSPSVGRAHAEKASKLAADGQCARAVDEYKKAYEILEDPALLFNRAECLRTLGRDEDALADYERFLVELPHPPNGPLVEQRIDELRKRLEMPPRGPGLAHAGARSGTGGERSLAPGPPAAAPILDMDVPNDETDEDEPEPDTDGAAGSMLPAYGGPSGVGHAGLRLGRDDEAPSETDDGVSPWVWVTLGAALVAAGAVVGVLILSKEDTEIPESGLGNYKF